MRLAKHLAHAGVASRRAAERLVAEGRVTVDRLVVLDPASDVGDDRDIRVDGRPVKGVPEQRTVWMVHKPAGVVSTAADTHGRKVVVDLVTTRDRRRLYPVGRLDVDATGLILLTDDGDLAHRLTHPRYEVPKTYRVRVHNGRVADQDLRRLREGIELEDGRTAPARVRQTRPGELELTIHEGRNRQIKRMCAAIGHPVQRLKRIAFGGLGLGDLGVGQARELEPAEVQRLRAT